MGCLLLLMPLLAFAPQAVLAAAPMSFDEARHPLNRTSFAAAPITGTAQCALRAERPLHPRRRIEGIIG